jgi:hypothetical protein
MGACVLMVVLAGRIPYTSQRVFSSSSSLRADSMSALRRLSVCLRVLASVKGARGVRAIEKHLGLATASARLAPARGPHKAAGG